MLNSVLTQLNYKIAPDFTDIPFSGQCYIDFPLFAMNDPMLMCLSNFTIFTNDLIPILYYVIPFILPLCNTNYNWSQLWTLFHSHVDFLDD